MTQSDGLWIFIATVVLDANGLVVDLLLWHLGQPTITEFARRNWWLAAIILTINGIGVFGLSIHLSPEPTNK